MSLLVMPESESEQELARESKEDYSIGHCSSLLLAARFCSTSKFMTSFTLSFLSRAPRCFFIALSFKLDMLRDVAFRAAALVRVARASLTGSAAGAATGQQVRPRSERGRPRERWVLIVACVLVGAFVFFFGLLYVFLPAPQLHPSFCDRIARIDTSVTFDCFPWLMEIIKKNPCRRRGR